MVDLWGRLLSKSFLQDPNHGATLTLSSIRYKSEYIKNAFPFPILVATSRKAEGEDLDLNSPIYEFTPEDLNVWHPSLNASFPIEYLGSKTAITSGKATECAKGFDNLGFLMGASSNIFSYQDGKDLKKSFWTSLTDIFVKGRFYEALVPNPFVGLGHGPLPGTGFPDGELQELLLADGAMAQETLPLFPLLHPFRNVDVILAVDSTVDGRAFDNPHQKGYPNGTALYRTSLKLKQPGYESYRFPHVPETYRSTKFADLGYNKRPTFFGCDQEGPLIVYIPNYYVNHDTSHATMQAVYTRDEIDGYFENGFHIATQTHGPHGDPEWAACLACALIDRQNSRNNSQRTKQCTECLSRYCAAGFD